MAKLELRLSSKVQNATGRSEILISLFYNRMTFRAKSRIFINPDYFLFYIDWQKTEDLAKGIGKVVKRTKDGLSSLAKAQKNGYILRTCGELDIRQTLETPEVLYHREKRKELTILREYILKAFENADKKKIKSDWLRKTIDGYYQQQDEQDNAQKKEQAHNLIYPYIDRYVKKRQLAEPHSRVYYVLSRAIARYEGFVRATDKKRKTFHFDIDKVTREDIEDFSDYLRNEQQLSEEYPAIFKKLINNYPNDVRKGHETIQARGENTVVKMRTRLKSVFRFCLEEGYTSNRPFDGIKIGVCKVGTPYYITTDERNHIAEADLTAAWESLNEDERKKIPMTLKTICEQRDIFVFQCLIGCRVGDLLQMTEQHIHNGILVYTPHKTKDEGKEAMQARVPLHQRALALIEHYRGADRRGRLFPFISAHKYNLAIKTIFKLAGVTRNVEIRNPKTGENELRPINEVATSHLARRTFIGGLYFRVPDPNLIGKMSGHVEGSKAFRRYRNIEDTALLDIINNNLG